MFNKNLEAIDNLALKRRLTKLDIQTTKIGISYYITASNDYVLIKKDMPIDDLENPRVAIKNMLKENIKNELKSNDIIINFGIGLGYLLDECYSNYPAKIFIYEPDLELLHFVLSNADISEHLSSGRVYISNDLDELINKLTETYLTKDKVEITYIPNYAISKNRELLLLTQKVFDSCKTKMVDINTITRFSKTWLINSIENLSYINENKGYLLSDLENMFTNQTALIIAAGPSLNDNLEIIKANRNKYVIFAVNKIVKYLFQNDILPDFVVCLDAGNMEKTLGNFSSLLSKCNCIMDIRADKYISKIGFDKIFYTFSDTDFLMQKLAKHNSFMKFYETGGTAATLALTSAVKMGFAKIIFTGLDLAFKDNLIYGSGELMNRISQEEIKVDNVKKNLVQVKSVNGDYVYTRDDYKTFISHFEILIKELKFSNLYNTSPFGALIEGMKNKKMEEIDLYQPASMYSVNISQPFKFDFKDFIQEEFYQINNIISILSKGVFSSALISAILKSSFIYQYMQADVLKVLQHNFAPELANDFIDNTKKSIKSVVEMLQSFHLI